MPAAAVPAQDPLLEILPAHAVRAERGLGPAGALFVKRAAPRYEWVLESEAAGLETLARAAALRVPRVLSLGRCGEEVVLELEWIERGPDAPKTDAELGRRLAQQHRVTAGRFGWERRGTIGRTTQINDWCDDWLAFFRDRRLRPQLELLGRGEGLLGEAGAALIAALPALMAGHRPSPSLLHGDLWAGNWLPCADGSPAVLDPAVYYGDREADVAMTRLFGGFGRRFYEAYAAEWPPVPGHAVRGTLYNLYHVLNHANLFGGDYALEAARMIEGLLAETRG